jgi:anti-anti-sigma factor
MMQRPTFDGNVKKIELCEKDEHFIIKVLEDLTLYSKFDLLTEIISKALKDGKKTVALSFTRKSYLNTKLIATLVQYWKLAQDKGATFGLISPNKDILDALRTIGLADMISIYSSEEEIGA